MEKTDRLQFEEKIIEELKVLDEQNIEVEEGICLKPSQCFRYSFDPLHLLFNTNCPGSLKAKVTSIFEKYSYPNGGTPLEVNNINNISSNIPSSPKELKPEIYQEGAIWHAYSEEDIGLGISGCGPTPEKAIEDFNTNYAKAKENSF
jgi:hypothetical protein